MALARYGPLVQTVVGTIGTVTFKGGACQGVLTRRARRAAINSPAQLNHQAVFTAHTAAYAALTTNERATWATIGKSFTSVNRVGVRRSMTSRECFLSFLAGVDPDGTHPGQADPPPAPGVSVSPVFDWAYFNTSGLAYINVFNPPEGGATERLWLTRALNFGPRNSGGRHAYIGEAARTLTFLNWDSAIRAKGIDLVIGEEILLEFTWTQPTAPWPCRAITARLSVSVG